MQRLRIKFKRGYELKFLSHLDIMRLWQRAFHRAEIPLAYSKGFSPHPQISLAAPLAIGITSEAEIMDIICKSIISLSQLSFALSKQLPTGIEILKVYPIDMTQPSLQSQVRYSEYKVTMASEKSQTDIECMITTLLSKKMIPWQNSRDNKVRKYNLRSLINNIWLINNQQLYCIIGMRLVCDNKGAGRPEQVTVALGFQDNPNNIHRTRLILTAEN